MVKVREKVKAVRKRARPGRDFAERRAVVERGRSATWQVTIALIAATIGAAALGYLAVQLYFLPEMLRESRLNRVPSLTGMDLDDAVDKGEASGYVVAATGRDYSDEVDRGDVIFQSPPPDTYLPRGDTLRVLVSLGAADERVPDVSGLDLELARRVLAQMRIRVGEVSREASDVHPQGTVIRSTPAAGTPLEEIEGENGDPVVMIVLSRGGSRLTMPDVRDLTLAQARDTLEAHGLAVGEVTGLDERALDRAESSPDDAQVVVTGQAPAPGWLVPAGAAVNLTLGPRVRRSRPAPEAPAEVEPEAEDEGPAQLPFEDVPAPPDTAPR